MRKHVPKRTNIMTGKELLEIYQHIRCFVSTDH